MSGFLVLIGCILLVLAPGVYFSWKYRDYGKFKITQTETNEVELWYNYRGEWLLDSTHPSEHEARECIKRKLFKPPTRLNTSSLGS